MAAVVDDAAIPVGIDVAGLDAGGVVDVEGEGGDNDAGQGEEKDEVAHDFSGYRVQGTGHGAPGTGHRKAFSVQERQHVAVLRSG